MADKQDDKLEQLHAMAAELMTMGNDAGDTAGIRKRIGALISGGYDFSDTLHNVFLDFGYPMQLKFSNFWNMYRRFGIAKNRLLLCMS